MKILRLLIILIFAAVIAGCGNDGSAPDNGEMPAEQPLDDDATDAQTPDAVSATLTVQDIDRWQRGMDAELEAVEEAEENLSRAATSDDTLNAMMAANDMSTRAAGAQAAGVSEERYEFIRSTLSSAVSYLTPLDQEMDVSQMPEAAIQQFEQSREASLEQMGDVLPEDVREALRERAVELRLQDMRLTTARLSAVGM